MLQANDYFIPEKDGVAQANPAIAGQCQELYYNHFEVDNSYQDYAPVLPACKKMIGYDLDFLVRSCVAFNNNQWHTNDAALYQQHIFPQLLQFLKSVPAGSYGGYSFCYNYRVKITGGLYITILQRTAFSAASGAGNPFTATAFFTDITGFKEDSKIIFLIEKEGGNCNALAKEHLFKFVYSPDSLQSSFSRREQEILQLIYEGASSKEIATTLWISINTVNNHRKNMLQKTGCKNFTQLLNSASVKKNMSMV